MAHEITDETLDEILANNSVVIIDFWAEWCGPCRMVAPVIAELAETYKGKAFIGSINVDENPDSPSKFMIRNIPTILYFKDGKLVDKVVGAMPKATFQTKLDALL
ncbi:thioredoxin [Microbacter margulisiae]|uniref:Thioredoxin n=1 Tax=Microbacter margulisiae TaxID=1350067 RepID=A0A7W5DNS5_9PORP|nr:thioredoxin [Microbacter margulisiae]MBB3185844.1 thioredoxin 1 [Microbacter margulisiae]